MFSVFQVLQYIFSHWKKSKYLSAVNCMTDPVHIAASLKLPSNLAEFLSHQPKDIVIAMFVSVINEISKK
jgi:hypothetical protein